MKITKTVYLHAAMHTFQRQPELNVNFIDLSDIADCFAVGQTEVTFEVPDNYADQINAYFAEKLQGDKEAFQAEASIKLKEFDEAIQSLKALPSPEAA